FALGYYRFGSHELLPVEQCPISSPLINRAIAAIWELGRRGVFAGSGIEEIEFFVNHSDSEMLLELYLRHGAEAAKPDELYATLQNALPELTSAAWFAAGTATKSEHVGGRGWIEYQAGGHKYHVSAGSFFQTNRFLAEKLIDLVTNG